MIFAGTMLFAVVGSILVAYKEKEEQDFLYTVLAVTLFAILIGNWWITPKPQPAQQVINYDRSVPIRANHRTDTITVPPGHDMYIQADDESFSIHFFTEDGVTHSLNKMNGVVYSARSAYFYGLKDTTARYTFLPAQYGANSPAIWAK